MGDASSLNPAFLKDVFVLLVVLVGAGAAVVSMLRRPASVPQPLEVTAAKEMLTRQTHDDHCQLMNNRVGALEQRMNRVESKMESNKTEIIGAMGALQEKVSDVGARVSGLEERTEATNAALAVQDKKLDVILSKL
jgi:hypothetical protein